MANSVISTVEGVRASRRGVAGWNTNRRRRPRRRLLRRQRGGAVLFRLRAAADRPAARPAQSSGLTTWTCATPGSDYYFPRACNSAAFRAARTHMDARSRWRIALRQRYCGWRSTSTDHQHVVQHRRPLPAVASCSADRGSDGTGLTGIPGRASGTPGRPAAGIRSARGRGRTRLWPPTRRRRWRPLVTDGMSPGRPIPPTGASAAFRLTDEAQRLADETRAARRAALSAVLDQLTPSETAR